MPPARHLSASPSARMGSAGTTVRRRRHTKFLADRLTSVCFRWVLRRPARPTRAAAGQSDCSTKYRQHSAIKKRRRPHPASAYTHISRGTPRRTESYLIPKYAALDMPWERITQRRQCPIIGALNTPTPIGPRASPRHTPGVHGLKVVCTARS
ncbi:hypothetical protein HYPSUDRAFT_212969 [Hypholoma sublateritium FD-334 SS-4]|uniref:Uncharacterized protein n=1 Tax=Hypholoma sublateritium (strain FD-334 SS-4) TaxID=945553 RepID=A0A0D2MS62_HYPSF|nr:hypothetical protein HYPSUDRAFT_212969 [Hypholoma sublateritium FD-334 SS-4]